MATSSENPPVDLGFVVGPLNAEDLEPIPGGCWMIASGMVIGEQTQGHLYLIDTEAKTSEELFPAAVKFEPVGEPYDTTPPDASIIDAHGLALRPGDDGVHTLYVVNHGGREAIEIFSVDARGERPVLTWIGAVIQHPGVWGNAVDWLTDGGIVITNYLDLNDPTAFDKVYAGEITGNLKQWHTETGWIDVPGTECSSPNGVTATRDGRWWFICSWSAKKLIRVSRDQDPVRRDEVPVDCLADNAKIDADGKVMIAGQIDEPATVFAAYRGERAAVFPFLVMRFDPDTLESTEVLRGTNPDYGSAATGTIVGDELWLSNAIGDRLAYLPAR
jgi:hypothetical protein